MTHGFVTPDLKTAVHVHLVNADGTLTEAEVFVDTGFNGSLALSLVTLSEVDAAFLEEATVQLADGNVVSFSVFMAFIEWAGERQTVEVFATNGDPLLGMRLLEGSELRIEVKSGGAVTIEPLN